MNRTEWDEMGWDRAKVRLVRGYGTGDFDCEEGRGILRTSVFVGMVDCC